MTWLWVFLGGGVGSLLRYLFAKLLLPYKDIFPFGTLMANILACLILGCLVAYGAKSGLTLFQKHFFVVGLCGGFSTFSTFSNEIVQLQFNGASTQSFLYLFVSILLGILAIVFGLYLGSKL